ncbi:hypothetical protein PF672P2_00009 [Parabacteroides phage PF672P2]|nr:hypothetical protein PF672P1_00048 [Parabacteroides phage PF672P1]WAX17146.1 hypothetical protein PF672P2_00009 [Parabacteroides phage PF672P2]
MYINKDAETIYVELDAPLDQDNNQIGSTWEDYIDGAWLLLSDEQVAFHDANPDASVEEVFNMQLTPVPEEPDPTPVPEPDPLFSARQAKLIEIIEQDTFSNKFFVSVKTGGQEVANQELWIDKDLRNSLYSITLPALLSDGETTTKLWSTGTPPQSIDVPIIWAIEKLPLLEIYAKRTYDLRASNEAAAYAASTVEEIAQIDAKADYPLFLTFELNLDNQGQA